LANARPASTDKWLPLGLAFVGGFGDASGLLLANTFTGHVTGNLVLLAIAAASQNLPGVMRNAGAIATFLIGILLSAVLGIQLKRHGSVWLLPVVMTIEVFLIAAAALAMNSLLEYRIAIFIVCVALALGLQNGALRSIGRTSVHTTYLTGMITNLITTAADKEFDRASTPAVIAHDPTLRLLGGIWMSFLLGAAVGAVMVLRWKGLGILGAEVALLPLLVRVLWAQRAQAT
jgi:uncharacterized membrane protein YoaK (UPF0700 family)